MTAHRIPKLFMCNIKCDNPKQSLIYLNGSETQEGSTNYYNFSYLEMLRQNRELVFQVKDVVFR